LPSGAVRLRYCRPAIDPTENKDAGREESMTVTRRALVAGGLALAVGSRARAASQSDLAAAARKDGGATLYTITDPITNQELAAAFSAKFGFPLSIERLSSAPMAQRFLSEMKANAVGADVMVSGDHYFMHDGKAKGWFAAEPDLPALQGLSMQAWDGTLAAVQFNLRTVIWNTDAIKSLPPRWDVLVDPKWTGRVGYFDPRNSFPNVHWLQMLRKTYGEDFLRKLGKQAVAISSTIIGSQQVAAGAIDIFAPAAHAIVGPLRAKGAPLGEVVPQPYSGTGLYAAIPVKAPHPQAARLLLDFLMSRDGQAIMNRGAVSYVPNVPGAEPIPHPIWPEMPEQQAREEQPKLLALLGLQ
jgi:ABC-type Fe3+ transport system substrate-binding protein